LVVVLSASVGRLGGHPLPLRLVPSSSGCKLCLVLYWAINDGACGRRPLPGGVGVMSCETTPFLWRPAPVDTSLLVCPVCLGMGLRRKPLPSCGMMMLTPDGAVFPSLRLAGVVVVVPFFVPTYARFFTSSPWLLWL
jgi:hypothetical protein